MTNKIKATISPSQIPMIMSGDPELVSMIFLNKTGRLSKPSATEAMSWGRHLEKFIIRYAGNDIAAVKAITQQAQVAHINLKSFYGFADGVVLHDDGTYSLIEAKLTSKYIKLNYANTPSAWMLQCQSYLSMATKQMNKELSIFKHVTLACLSQGTQFTKITIEPKLDIQERIFRAARAFVDALRADDLSLFDTTEHAYLPVGDTYKDRAIKATPDLSKKLNEYSFNKNNIAQLKSEQMTIEQDIKDALGTNECLLSAEGALLAKYTYGNDGTRRLSIKNV